MKSYTGDRALSQRRLTALASVRGAASPTALLHPKRPESAPLQRSLPPGKPSGLSLLLHQSGLACSPTLYATFVIAIALSAAFLSTAVFPLGAAPFFAAVGGCLPFAWLGQRVRRRALSFSLDYPAVLLATASSVQVGLPPHDALLRATRLLPKENVTRCEVETLLKRLSDGIPKDAALQYFADSYAVPDVELFRSAFLLATETGGRFSPTLQRIAAVSNNRMSLLNMAAVSTASMRMTANVLLCIAPAILLFLSARISGFWDLFYNNPTANFLAAAGVFLIASGYLTLRKMSGFKP